MNVLRLGHLVLQRHRAVVVEVGHFADGERARVGAPWDVEWIFDDSAG